MKHKIHNKKDLLHPYVIIEVELISENESERDAIQNMDRNISSQAEQDLIENYLLFGLNYSVLSIEQQQGNRFILKAATE